MDWTVVILFTIHRIMFNNNKNSSRIGSTDGGGEGDGEARSLDECFKKPQNVQL